MNRREILTTVAATGFAPGLTASALMPGTAKNSALPQPVNGPRMNFDQADKVMAELELDALVLGNGLNFRHATGMRPVASRMGFPPSTFAVVTRQSERRVVIVAPTFIYYYNIADVQADNPIPAYIYGTAIGNEDIDDSTAPVALTVFSDRGEVPIDELESARVKVTDQALERWGTFADLSAALKRALKDSGSGEGRIAIDHPRIAAALSAVGSKATTVDADDALRRIRPVKSANEIQLMREAATGNVAAALEALKTVRAGGSYRDLRAEFFAAAARRGQRGVFMVIDRSSDEQFDARIRDGQAFLIDCVSEYEGYHGDYGRTVFVGEPAPSMLKATKAMADAWNQVREQLKPGLKFSQIQALGQQSLKRAGRSYRIPFRPHSVGLYHTDHFGTSGLPPPADMVLEAGMIISVDCPMLESGVGGSAHLEDLMLITADGSEPIHDIGQQVITV